MIIYILIQHKQIDAGRITQKSVLMCNLLLQNLNLDYPCVKFTAPSKRIEGYF